MWEHGSTRFRSQLWWRELEHCKKTPACKCIFFPSSTLTFRLMSTPKITLICLICSLQSSSVFKIKDGDYKTLHSRLKQIVDGTQHLKGGLTRLAKKTIVGRRPISAQPVSKLSEALWRRGRKRKETTVATTSLLWRLNSTSNSPLAPRRLSCQISANQREEETSANETNVGKHVPGVMTSLLMSSLPISFRMNFFDIKKIFKFQRRSCKLSFLFRSRHQSAPESLLSGLLR